MSIASGAEVIRALDGLGHTVVAIDTAHGVLGWRMAPPVPDDALDPQ